MKLLFTSAVLLTILFTSCQRKLYAPVQKHRVESFTYSSNSVEKKMQVEELLITKPQNDELTASIVSEGSKETFVTYQQDIDNKKDEEEFNYKQEYINQELSGLDKLEAFIDLHEGATIEEAESTGLLTDLNIERSTTQTIKGSNELPLNIPAFWWGCCLGGLGILMVYIFTEDKEQTKKALYGCLALGAGIAVIYLVLIVLGLSTSFSY